MTAEADRVFSFCDVRVHIGLVLVKGVGGGMSGFFGLDLGLLWREWMCLIDFNTLHYTRLD